jgi:hypothetical protein
MTSAVVRQPVSVGLFVTFASRDREAFRTNVGSEDE